MRNQHEEMIAAAMAAQRQVARALHAAADPTWLHLDLTMGQLKALFALADEALTVGGWPRRWGSGSPPPVSWSSAWSSSAWSRAPRTRPTGGARWSA